VVAGALGAAAVLRDGGHDVLLLVIGAAAVVLLLVGLLLRWSAALAVAIALLGAQQATRLGLGPDALDEATPLVAGGLLLAAELAWWSIEPRVPAWAEPRVAVWRVATVALTCVAAMVVSAVVVVAAGAPVAGGTLLLLTGIVAATAALAVLAFVARNASAME
jgi:hypothetical protein